jgi:hypothetical protein
MKINKLKKEIKKFDLEKMEVAKLKNMHLIKGGSGEGDTDKPQRDSSGWCEQIN